MSDQVNQVGPAANVKGHFTSFSEYTKGLCSSVVQANRWDLSLIARPLFDGVPGFNLVLQAIIFVSESDVSAGVDPEHLYIQDSGGYNDTIQWHDLQLNQAGACSIVRYSGGFQGRIVPSNLSVNDSTGAGVASGFVNVYVLGFLVPANPNI